MHCHVKALSLKVKRRRQIERARGERERESIVAGQIDAAFVCELTADKVRAAVFVFRWPFLRVPHCHFDVLSYNGCLPFSARAANKISGGGD